MRDRLLKIFLYIILSGLLLLAAQGHTGFVRERQLRGGDEPPEPRTLSLESVTSGEFQRYVNQYLNYYTGFRKSLVRFNNQVSFSLFGSSNAPNVMVGKHHVLYELMYVNSYRGLDYIGRARIISNIRRLQEFQKRMSREHIHFMLVFTPSKARFMPEDLPDKFHDKGRNTNYETYVYILTKEATDLHFLDLNKYFRLLKDSSEYALYPKGGSHWTTFSAVHYGLDTLLRYMESLSGQKYTLLKTNRVHWTDTLHPPDDDLSSLLNLVSSYPGGSLPYAEYGFDSTGRTKPHPLFIADSYFWLIFGFKDIKRIFRECDFWEWNTDFFPKTKYKEDMAKDFVYLRRDIL